MTPHASPPPAPGPIANLPAPEGLDVLSDPATRIILSCERAKEWLAAALANDDIEQIVELKSQAEAIRVYTMQKQLGKDAELSASEIVRRAERCIGLAIRKGQEAGRILKPGQHASNVRAANISRIIEVTGTQRSTLSQGPYALSDSVSDEAFDAAIEEAKAEGNLSRANVVRKVRGVGKPDRWKNLAELAAAGHSSSQIAEIVGVGREAVVIRARRMGVSIPADVVQGSSRRLNHNRVLTEFSGALEALAPSCELIDPAKVDPQVLAECVAVMEEALSAITAFAKRLKRGMQRGR